MTVDVWAVVFLGVIAVATLGTAAMQIGLMLYASRLTRRATDLIQQIERDVKPLLESATAVGRDAARVSALAVAQMERADRACGDLAVRLGETLATVQRTLVVPAREGMALVAALRAVVAAFRGGPSGPADRKRSDEEEALFI